MDVILGAGPAGLGAYLANPKASIYEKNNKVGGLCSSFTINTTEGEFVFDNAVHLSFAKDDFVRNIFDETPYFTHYPVPYSWYTEKWLQHPAQNNMYPLTAEEKTAAIVSFVGRKRNDNVDNFKDWMTQQYGEYLYEKLFKLYNEKYWCFDLGEIGVEWIGNRLYQPSLEEVLYGSYTDKTPNTYYAKEMRYPKEGGYGSFFQNIAKNADNNNQIKYEKTVKKIDVNDKIIMFSDNSEIKYDKCYSSIPMPEIIKVIDDVPSDIKEKSEDLEWTNMALCSIAFNKTVEMPNIWFYIYDMDIMSPRAYSPSLKSSNNVPQGKSSIQFELYSNRNGRLPSKEDAINNCIYALEKMGIATKEDILYIDYRKIDYANVVFKKDTTLIAEVIRKWLSNHGIESIGRFGRWEYLWSDQAFLSGYHTVKNGGLE